MIGCQWKNVLVGEQFIWRDVEDDTEWCGRKFTATKGLLDNEDGSLLEREFGKNDMVLIKHRG